MAAGGGRPRRIQLTEQEGRGAIPGLKADQRRRWVTKVVIDKLSLLARIEIRDTGRSVTVSLVARSVSCHELSISFIVHDGTRRVGIGIGWRRDKYLSWVVF